MMRPIAIVGCLCAVVLATGCAGLSEQESARVAGYRAEASQTIAAFEEGLREDDVDQIARLISPELPGPYRRNMVQMAKDAALLGVYSGYEANPAAAVAGPSPKDWLDGSVVVKVPGTNAFGDEIPEKLKLVRSGDAWYIARMNLARPEPGAVIEPDPKTQTEIADVARNVLQALRSGKIGRIMTMLPEGNTTQWVTTNPTFWERATGSAPMRISLPELVQEVFVPLEVTRWPDPLDDMTVLYQKEGGLIALYEMPFNWPDAPAGNSTMELEVHVFRSADGWKLHTLRLYGPPLEELKIRRDE
jgi:hypothetical protein